MKERIITLSSGVLESGEKFKKIHSLCSLDNYFRRTVPLWKRLIFRSNSGLYPEKFSYIITPNGIFNDNSIRCNYCGEEKDITDYGEV